MYLCSLNLLLAIYLFLYSYRFCFPLYIHQTVHSQCWFHNSVSLFINNILWLRNCHMLLRQSFCSICYWYWTYTRNQRCYLWRRLRCYSLLSNCLCLHHRLCLHWHRLLYLCRSYGCLLLSNNSCLCNWWGRLGYYRSYDWGPYIYSGLSR